MATSFNCYRPIVFQWLWAICRYTGTTVSLPITINEGAITVSLDTSQLIYYSPGIHLNFSNFICYVNRDDDVLTNNYDYSGCYIIAIGH